MYPLLHLQITTKEFLNELVRRFPERPLVFHSPFMSQILDLMCQVELVWLQNHARMGCTSSQRIITPVNHTTNASVNLRTHSPVTGTSYGQCSITRKGLEQDQNAGHDAVSTNDCHKRVPSVLRKFLSTRQGHRCPWMMGSHSALI